ncbi:MAG: hypothetical protein HY860_06425 [Chlamydiales bacterium]|nr:hypothetical protein [Chlamydiales bacterium]
MKRISIVAVFISLSTLLVANTKESPECLASREILENMPLFTGPLLTPSAHIVPLGHWNLEPYVYVISNYGSYNQDRHIVYGSHNVVVNPQLPIWVGLTSFMDIVAYPQFFSRFRDGESSTQFGDLEIGLEFQLLMDSPDNFYPGLKLFIGEIFPTGPYNNLNPNKLGTDLGGAGTYLTEFTLVGTRVWNLYRCHYLSFKSAITYGITTPVEVNGFNNYGGGFGTHGKVKPGNQFTFFAALEYNLSIHWGLACDIEYFYTNKTSFSGTPGVTTTGSVASSSRPSSEQWSISPAVEYNFNENIGIIAGSWLTFAGRNSQAFISGVAALNIYY